MLTKHKQKKKYKSHYTYMVKIKDIIIQDGWERIGKRKIKERMDFFAKHKRLKSQIILNENYELVDGFTSYKVAQTNNLKHVPVYFVDEYKND